MDLIPISKIVFYESEMGLPGLIYKFRSPDSRDTPTINQQSLNDFKTVMTDVYSRYVKLYNRFIDDDLKVIDAQTTLDVLLDAVDNNGAWFFSAEYPLRPEMMFFGKNRNEYAFGYFLNNIDNSEWSELHNNIMKHSVYRTLKNNKLLV